MRTGIGPLGRLEQERDTIQGAQMLQRKNTSQQPIHAK
jgi:hypothetical protein